MQALLDSLRPGWSDTQTIAPTGATVTSVGDRTIWLEWGAVTYTTDAGGYRVLNQELPAGSVASAGRIADKATTCFPVTGLKPQISYDLTIEPVTLPHIFNAGVVTSEPGPPVLATTGAGGCAAPVIQASSLSSPATLTVVTSHDSYAWSTGETSAAITVSPLVDTWYWVVVLGRCDGSRRLRRGGGRLRSRSHLLRGWLRALRHIRLVRDRAVVHQSIDRTKWSSRGRRSHWVAAGRSACTSRCRHLHRTPGRDLCHEVETRTLDRSVFLTHDVLVFTGSKILRELAPGLSVVTSPVSGPAARREEIEMRRVRSSRAWLHCCVPSTRFIAAAGAVLLVVSAIPARAQGAERYVEQVTLPAADARKVAMNAVADVWCSNVMFGSAMARLSWSLTAVDDSNREGSAADSAPPEEGAARQAAASKRPLETRAEVTIYPLGFERDAFAVHEPSRLLAREGESPLKALVDARPLVDASAPFVLLEELQPGVLYTWRIAVRVDDTWAASRQMTFMAPTCPVDTMVETGPTARPGREGDER